MHLIFRFNPVEMKVLSLRFEITSVVLKHIVVYMPFNKIIKNKKGFYIFQINMNKSC